MLGIRQLVYTVVPQKNLPRCNIYLHICVLVQQYLLSGTLEPVALAILSCAPGISDLTVHIAHPLAHCYKYIKMKRVGFRSSNFQGYTYITRIAYSSSLCTQ